MLVKNMAKIAKAAKTPKAAKAPKVSVKTGRGRPKKDKGVNSLTNFTGKLHPLIAKSKDNAFYSGYSLNVALGMCLQGAEDQTKNELQASLSVSANNQDYYKNLVNICTVKGKPYVLTTANALWLNKKFNVKEKWLKATKDNFNATAQVVDFSTDESVDTINQWCSDQTNEKIKSILEKGSVNDDTRSVLTNAIYFKGNWKFQFDKKQTFDREFLNCGKKPTMHNNLNLQYFENKDFQAITLPYEGDDLSMVVMLPTANNTEAIDNNFENCYNNVINNSHLEEEVSVFLPKFKLETEYKLVDQMKNLGCNLAFTDFADFSGISDERTKIDAIIQKAYVEVDEKGTEAAAVTAVVMMRCAAFINEPVRKVFDANRPFVFAIKHNATNEILFTGRVAKL